MVWLGARDGSYVVKKGYHRVRSKRRNISSRSSTSMPLPKELWNQVWKLKVLPKINHFIWRCSVQAVPMKERLYRRRCSQSDMCPICQVEPETLEHAIFSVHGGVI